jgi:phage host-nuclease inhibitor protein Gam
MARKRVESSVKDWAGVDQVLLEIGQIDRQIESAEAQAQEGIEAIRTEAVKLVKPWQEQKAALELQLRAFCEAHRGEIKGKSKPLNFGTVSFRLSTKIVIRGVQACIDGLKALGLAAYVRVKEQPDKEKMKDLDDAILAQVGASRKTEDAFGYEVNRERVKEAA